MERLAIKWATLEPDAIGSYVTYADAVQAVEEVHRSYGGLPSQLEEAKAKIKELESIARSTAEALRDERLVTASYNATVKILKAKIAELKDHPHTLSVRFRTRPRQCGD